MTQPNVKIIGGDDQTREQLATSEAQNAELRVTHGELLKELHRLEELNGGPLEPPPSARLMVVEAENGHLRTAIERIKTKIAQLQ